METVTFPPLSSATLERLRVLLNRIEHGAAACVVTEVKHENVANLATLHVMIELPVSKSGTALQRLSEL